MALHGLQYDMGGMMNVPTEFRYFSWKHMGIESTPIEGLEILMRILEEKYQAAETARIYANSNHKGELEEAGDRILYDNKHIPAHTFGVPLEDVR